jgi:hypothetical protein
VAIIKVVVEELNNTILEYHISHWRPPIAFGVRCNCICECRITLESGLKKFLRSWESKVTGLAINPDGQGNITKLLLLGKKLLKSCHFIAVIASNDNRGASLSLT